MTIVYYDQKQNIFSNEFGWVIYNIFKYITPNQLYLWRYKKGNVAEKLPTKDGETIEIVVI